MFSWRASRLVLAISFLILFAGCAKGVKLVPTKGVFTINGKPAANIFVQFMPDSQKGNSGPTSQAYTGLNGEFELMTTDNRPGAVPGQHRVILVDSDEERPAQGEKASKPPRIDSSFSTAGGALMITVHEGQPVEINIVKR